MASYFSHVFKHMSTLRGYPTSLTKKFLQYEEITKDIQALKWGRKKEAEACTSDMTKMEKEHTNFVVHWSCSIQILIIPTLELVLMEVFHVIAAGKECWKLSVLTNTEMTCLSKAALSDRAYFLEKDASTEEIHLSKSHKYYYQVQGQVSICDVGYCDFV